MLNHQLVLTKLVFLPRKAFNNINIGYFNKILNVTLIIAIDLIFKLSTVEFYTGELQGLPSIGNRI